MPVCQEAQQIVDWQLHFENSEPSRGIWAMTYQGWSTAQKSDVGGPPPAGRTTWQDLLRYGCRTSWSLRVGPKTKVKWLSCLPSPRWNCHSLVCPLLTYALLLSQDLCLACFFFCPSSFQFDCELPGPLWFTSGIFFISVPSALKHAVLLTNHYFTRSLTHSKYSVRFQWMNERIQWIYPSICLSMYLCKDCVNCKMLFVGVWLSTGIITESASKCLQTLICALGLRS